MPRAELLLALLLPVTALAAVIPDTVFGRYTAPKPVCTQAEDGNGYVCDQNGEDRVSVTPAEKSGIAAVQMNFIFANGHTCAFGGAGRWENDKLVVRESAKQAAAYSSSPCVVELQFTGDSATTRANPACSRYCGARGTLDGNVLYRAPALME